VKDGKILLALFGDEAIELSWQLEGLFDITQNVRLEHAKLNNEVDFGLVVVLKTVRAQL
jgi:hypothetical protein